MSATPTASATDDLIPLRPIWRMQITAQCMTLAALCHLVPWGTADIGRLPSNVISAAQMLVHELTEDSARKELARGSEGLRARKGILQDCNARLWELLKLFRPKDWAERPSAPGAQPVPRETPEPFSEQES